jgi:SAM-dependent methyltransferase
VNYKEGKKGYLWSLRRAAERDYWRQVLSMLESGENQRFLDCGCADGERTLLMAKIVGCGDPAGIEIVDELTLAAKQRGVTVMPEDLNAGLSSPDCTFDVVTSLESIEHLYRPEQLVKEIFRVLKPGGYATVATENLASWHNILALVMGWQPFSLSQFSEVKTAIGNPLGLDKGETWNPALRYPSFRHCMVLSYLGFRELFETHGFVVESLRGAGYYPLPAPLARVISACDPRHSAFLTIKVRKPT